MSRRRGYYRLLRYLFLGLAVGFLVFLGFMVYTRSKDRQSVIHPINSAATNSAVVSANAGSGKDSDAGNSELHLQEFHRVEVKDGRTLWEVRAQDARYFVDQGVTQVNEVMLRVYRENGSPLDLRAKAAKLHLQNDSLKEVELQGSISVQDQDGFSVYSELAYFDVSQGVIRSPSRVIVKGQGYELEGVGMELLLESQQVSLVEQVRSEFTLGAKPPVGIVDDKSIKGEKR